VPGAVAVPARVAVMPFAAVVAVTQRGSPMVMKVLALVATLAAIPASAEAQAPSDLSDADRVAVFKAAGAVHRADKWIICGDDPEASGASIDEVRDLNGDGQPEAVVSEGGSFCYGFTGTGFQLLSRQADGHWNRITGDIGIPEFLKTRGVGGWPDISIGGPGFCFPVQRWNGTEYVVQRHEYEGKACKPG
jgi:hypothetical protein